MKPLHIALQMLGGQDWVAGPNYFTNIIRSVAALPEAERVGVSLSLCCHRARHERFAEPLADKANIIYLDEHPAYANALGDRIRQTLKRRLLGISDPRRDAVLRDCGADVAYPFVTPGAVPYGCVDWMPDFQYRHFPDFFQPHEQEWRLARDAAIAKHARMVVLSSEHALSDFQTFFPAAAAKGRVLHFRTTAPDEWFAGDPVAVQKRYHLPERFFIVCNQFWRHKNHPLIWDALRILNARGVQPAIVCTGTLHDHRQPEFLDELLHQMHTSGIAAQIHLLGLIPRHDQVQLMRRALGVIQPSCFEGWSTVVEDARSLGKILLLSDFPVHIEQAPPGAIYFDRLDADALAAVIEKNGATLSPGADTERETAARAESIAQVADFGRRFISIMRECAPE